MSINTATNLAVTRHMLKGGATPTPPYAADAQAESKPGGGPAPSAADTGNSVGEAIKMVATYIPTEVVGTYLAIVGLIAASSNGVEWSLYVLFAAVTPIVVWVTFAAKLRQNHQSLPMNPQSWPWWTMIAGLVSFAVWGAALPGSVFNSISWWSPQVGGAAVIGAAFGVGLVSQLFKDASA